MKNCSVRICKIKGDNLKYNGCKSANLVLDKMNRNEEEQKIVEICLYICRLPKISTPIVFR